MLLIGIRNLLQLSHHQNQLHCMLPLFSRTLCRDIRICAFVLMENGLKFENKVVETLCMVHWLQHLATVSFYPRTNGKQYAITRPSLQACVITYSNTNAVKTYFFNHWSMYTTSEYNAQGKWARLVWISLSKNQDVRHSSHRRHCELTPSPKCHQTRCITAFCPINLKCGKTPKSEWKPLNSPTNINTTPRSKTDAFQRCTTRLFCPSAFVDTHCRENGHDMDHTPNCFYARL